MTRTDKQKKCTKSAKTTMKGANKLEKTFEKLNATTKPTVALRNRKNPQARDYPTSFAV
ncbi:hypothetical protein KJ807_05550 [Patescibacteria group bacterium]|nr:hypothetical protein [Patescibacteria group bacterium]